MLLKKATAIALLLPLLAVTSPVFAEEKVDLLAVYKIKNEAFQNSKVMDHMFYLTDVHGPRLTNSPGYRAAADWAVKQLQSYGVNAKLEKWGPFGRSWTYSKFSAHMLEPGYQPLIGFPLAWSSPTNGVVTGEAMQITMPTTDADLEKLKGKIRGKFLLTAPARELTLSLQPLARRYSEPELDALSLLPEPGAGRGGRGGGRPGQAPAGAPGGPPGAPGAPGDPNAAPGGRGGFNNAAQRAFRNKLNTFLREEGALAVIQSGRGDGGTLFAQSVQGASREGNDPQPIATVAILAEHYNRMVRLIEHKIPVKLELEVQCRLIDDNLESVNVIGEIPGGKRKDEIVMVGAHLDSWHGGTGATDNAAGSAVMIEVMRILKAINQPLDRTIRIGLWGGEEQGLLGSRAYVKEHFADRETMKLAAEHSKFSGYFNIDNGTGKVRGIYLQGNDMVRPVFESWMSAFKDLGMTTITARDTGGTDHQSFDAVGLPGFQFIQDPTEYDTRTHHSNMDVYDRIQRGDMMQISAIVASFVYNTAMRDEMLPRKPLPRPQPAGRGGRGGGQ
jgi:hypothetical protein